MTTNHTAKVISTIQICVSILAVAILSWIGYVMYISDDSLFIILEVVPKLTIVLTALVPSIVLRVKHQSEAVEGALIPLFLLFTTMESFVIVPSFYDYFGTYMVSYFVSVTLMRSIFLSAAVSLFFAAILNLQRDSMAKMSLYITFAILASVLISALIPVDELNPSGNRHNHFFTLCVLTVLILANITYFLAFLKDRESYKIKRFLTFFFISIGQFLIMLSNSFLVTNITGMAMMAVGALMLCLVGPDGY